MVGLGFEESVGGTLKVTSFLEVKYIEEHIITSAKTTRK